MRNHVITGALLFCALTLSSPTPVAAQGHIVEAGLRFWKPTPELVFSTDGLTGVGLDEVDFVEEFGLENKRFREIRASIGRNHKARISKVSFQYDAEASIQKTIVFQGQVFTVGAPAATDIKWDLWTFGYEWDFISRDAGFLGFIADLKYNKVVASIESPALASVAATDVTAPIPTIGLIGRAYLGSAGSITTEFTGISLSRKNEDTQFEGKFYDFDIYGTIHLGPNLGAQVGYRSVDAHYLVDGDSGDLKMSGLYFGGTLRF